MSYGKWIDQVCFCTDELHYYWREAQKLERLISEYLSALQQTPAGRAKIEGVAVPSDPVPLSGTHRQAIEWLHRRADFAAQLEYRAGLNATNGHMAALIWNGELKFIPPTKEHQYAA